MATAKLAAARARTMTPEQKMARALELAERNHLTYRSRYHGANEHGEAVFTVPSRSQPHRFHVVRLTPTGTWECGCDAGQWGMPCGHLGSAAHQWNIIQRAMSDAAAEANRRYHEFAAYLESCGY